MQLHAVHDPPPQALHQFGVGNGSKYPLRFGVNQLRVSAVQQFPRRRTPALLPPQCKRSDAHPVCASSFSANIPILDDINMLKLFRKSVFIVASAF
jgi:hypothetical protein